MEDRTIESLKELMKDGYPDLVRDYTNNTRFHLQMISVRLMSGKILNIVEHTNVIRSASSALGFMRLARLAMSLEDMASAYDGNARDLDAMRCMIVGMQEAFRDAEELLRGSSVENLENYL